MGEEKGIETKERRRIRECTCLIHRSTRRRFTGSDEKTQ